MLRIHNDCNFATKTNINGTNNHYLSKEYPDYSHMNCYAQCLMDILPLYGMYCQNTQFNSSEKHHVHIELECPSAEGDVFITGNQEAIANWNPEGIKMNKVDDNTYAIDLDLQLPAEFKFTQGSWDNQINPENEYIENLRIFSPENIPVDPIIFHHSGNYSEEFASNSIKRNR